MLLDLYNLLVWYTAGFIECCLIYLRPFVRGGREGIYASLHVDIFTKERHLSHADDTIVGVVIVPGELLAVMRGKGKGNHTTG